MLASQVLEHGNLAHVHGFTFSQSLEKQDKLSCILSSSLKTTTRLPRTYGHMNFFNKKTCGCHALRVNACICRAGPLLVSDEFELLQWRRRCMPEPGLFFLRSPCPAIPPSLYPAWPVLSSYRPSSCVLSISLFVSHIGWPILRRWMLLSIISGCILRHPVPEAQPSSGVSHMHDSARPDIKWRPRLDTLFYR